MSIRIELGPDMETALATQAQKVGVPVGQYIERILEQHLPARPVEAGTSPKQRANAFDDWAENFPYRRSTPLPDDAITRESFYQRDDE